MKFSETTKLLAVVLGVALLDRIVSGHVATIMELMILSCVVGLIREVRLLNKQLRNAFGARP